MKTDHKPTGRPPIDPDARRDQTLRLRLTKAEKAKADALGPDRIRELINRARAQTG